MARVICPGVPYHVTQRGNRRCSVFSSDVDRELYLEYLTNYSGLHGLAVLAYCLMSNHVHLVVVPETQSSLERVFRPLHQRHALRINRLRSWNGHLWQGRYFSSPLDESYLWAAIHYVERNPVVAGMTARAENYRWSSAAAHCGMRVDSVLTQAKYWVDLFCGVGDWASWLACEDNAEERSTLRLNTTKGLPCGSPQFIEQLAKTTGRTLQLRPRGRPRKTAC